MPAAKNFATNAGRKPKTEPFAAPAARNPSTGVLTSPRQSGGVFLLTALTGSARQVTATPAWRKRQQRKRLAVAEQLVHTASVQTKFAIALAVVAIIPGIIGCQTAKRSLLTATPTPQIVPQIVVVTNWQTLLVTNPPTPTAPAQIVTNTVPILVPVTNFVAVTNFVYTPAATVTNWIAAAQTVAPLIPPPAGEIVSGVLALALAGLGLFARAKSAQATSAGQMLTATIAGVEAAGHALTKASIQASAAAAGVQDQLDPIVQAVTKNMPAIPPSPSAAATPEMFRSCRAAECSSSHHRMMSASPSAAT